MIVLWLQQKEHTRRHLWHRYSVMVYQVMKSNNLSDDFNLTIIQ